MSSFPFLLLDQGQKKRHTPKMCPSLRPARRHNTHKTGMCRVNTRPHRLQKRIVFRLNSKCWFRDGRLQSVCQFFYPMIVVPDYTSITFREVPSAPPFVLIYITSVKKASRKGQNAANLSEKTAEWAKISLNSALQTLLAHAARGEQTTAVFFSPSATSFLFPTRRSSDLIFHGCDVN